jgi:hypothetical protein
MSTSTQPITGFGLPATGSSMRSHARQVSHRQITRTMGPWLCSSVDQMLRIRSTIVGT